MQTIMDYQKEFFLTGDETDLRPMILKDIAERTIVGYFNGKPRGQQQICANRIWNLSP